MAIPTDQRDRARHPERFARPDDENTKRIWTGIGAPPDKYGWGRNRAHQGDTPPTTAASRPTEVVERGLEIIEFIPDRQEQVDPWSLTSPHLAQGEVIEPRRATETLPPLPEITEYIPPEQEQRDPWSLTQPRRLEPEARATYVPRETLERPPTIVEYIPEPQPQVDPWSLTETRVIQKETTTPLRPTEEIELIPIVGEVFPELPELTDPWELTTPRVVHSKPDIRAPLESFDPPVEPEFEPPVETDPWSVTAPKAVRSPASTVYSVSDTPRGDMVREFRPDPQKQRDPWSLTKAVRGIVSETKAPGKK